jgi:hypothetical protein
MPRGAYTKQRGVFKRTKASNNEAERLLVQIRTLWIWSMLALVVLFVIPYSLRPLERYLLEAGVAANHAEAVVLAISISSVFLFRAVLKWRCSRLQPTTRGGAPEGAAPAKRTARRGRGA